MNGNPTYVYLQRVSVAVLFWQILLGRYFYPRRLFHQCVILIPFAFAVAVDVRLCPNFYGYHLAAVPLHNVRLIGELRGV